MASTLSAWDDAIRTTEKESRSRLAAAPPSERVRIHTSLAELYVGRGRYDDAIRELAAATQIDATQSAVHIFRGSVLELMGRNRDALDAYRTAWDLDRDDPVSAYLLASRRAPERSSDEPIPQAAALLKAEARRLQSVPADRHVPLFAELALVPDGAAVTPVFSPARYVDGLTLIAAARYQEAIAVLQRDAAADPLVAGSAMLSGPLQQAIARLRDGDAESAIADLQGAATSSPRSSELQRILANAYADLGDDEKSIEHLERAVALAPDDERSAVGLGRALMRAEAAAVHGCAFGARRSVRERARARCPPRARGRRVVHRACRKRRALLPSGEPPASPSGVRARHRSVETACQTEPERRSGAYRPWSRLHEDRPHERRAHRTGRRLTARSRRCGGLDRDWTDSLRHRELRIRRRGASPRDCARAHARSGEISARPYPPAARAR
jgi:tetratricopeptide (TPR) repeat protein